MTTTADTKTPSIPGEGQVTAVTYQRVSTKEQATTGGRDEGFSIPAQREANRRKAETLGAQVVAEFVNAGESARLAKRPELQRMLDYIATHRVTYCIVHKVDRLARNRLDDVDIRRHLINAGVQLVSATENIDETPLRHAAPRHHVLDCGVLLPQPGRRSHQTHDPESRRRRHPIPGTHRLPQHPAQG